MPESSHPNFSLETLPTAGDPYNHAATMAQLPNGDLLVAWVAGAHETANDTRIIATRFSAAAGAWSAPFILADTPNQPDANPVLYLDDRDLLHLWYNSMFGQTLCQSLVLTRTSPDLGQTWSADRLALPAICTLVRNRPISLADGRWLLPATLQAQYASQFFVSFDRGNNWLPAGPPLQTLPINNLQPAVVQLSDGSLFSLMRSIDGAGFTWDGWSCDGFLWLLTPRRDLPNPGSGLDLIRLASGHLLVAYNNNPSERTPLVVSISADDGRTWSAAKIIESGDGPLAYPCLAEGSDGMIHCVYSRRLGAVGHAVFNRAWVESSGL